MTEKIKSIRLTSSLDQSGRNAKRGFAYQDHVGVKLCLEMLLDSNIVEIWVEKEDDLTIIRSISGIETLEFCQVKHTQEKGSRWSIADICKPDSTVSGIGKSFVEKSLEQDRCEEEAIFRVISSYPVTQDLKCLTNKLGSIERINCHSDIKSLEDSIKERIGDIKSIKGTGLDTWLGNCYWQKLPDTIIDLRNSNILLLEKIISSYSIQLLSNHRDELYQMILGLVYEASSCDLKVNEEGHKINYDKLLKWIKGKAEELYFATSNDKLEEKILQAGGDTSLVKSARIFKYKFKKEKLDSDYVKPKSLNTYESAIFEKLHDLKIELYSDEISLDGMQFMNLCNKEVEKLTINLSTSDNGITSTLGKGIMYDLTSKCIHRFTKEIL